MSNLFGGCTCKYVNDLGTLTALKVGGISKCVNSEFRNKAVASPRNCSRQFQACAIDRENHKHGTDILHWVYVSQGSERLCAQSGARTCGPLLASQVIYQVDLHMTLPRFSLFPLFCSLLSPLFPRKLTTPSTTTTKIKQKKKK